MSTTFKMIVLCCILIQIDMNDSADILSGESPSAFNVEQFLSMHTEGKDVRIEEELELSPFMQIQSM